MFVRAGVKMTTATLAVRVDHAAAAGSYAALFAFNLDNTALFAVNEDCEAIAAPEDYVALSALNM